jgi:hypothetical protein
MGHAALARRDATHDPSAIFCATLRMKGALPTGNALDDETVLLSTKTAIT